jgi:predicted acyl esterase
MITKSWRTSERKYGIVAERDVSIRMNDGIHLDCDIFRPDGTEKYPAILGVHAFDKFQQSAPSMPQGFERINGSIEAGDSNFFVRRGYAHVIVNVRGTGKSEGEFSGYGAQEAKDTYEVIEWIARQPWCDGNVGMFGVSYFAISQLQVAALNPPHLKTIFAPFGYTDFYRDKCYHGGILSHAFLTGWANRIFRKTADYRTNAKFSFWTREKLGNSRVQEMIENALQDREIRAVPALVEVLKNPEREANPIIVDVLLNRFDGEYYKERNVKHEKIKVPAYFGACWGNYGLHLPGAFRTWEKTKAPKKMVIGPPLYLDRPLYQYQYESLRWFDHWLKGIENGIMNEPPVRLFVIGADEWKSGEDWPLPETKWTPFYLHSKGLLSEHEFWPNESSSSFEDNPYNQRGELTFLSPPLVENTEVIGPIALTLYASTTADEVLWFVSLLDVDPSGEEKLLTRGWLRGSQREMDPKRSKPWEPFHPHTKRESLKPGEIYEFNLKILPTANLYRPGHRIGLRIRCADDERPKTSLEAIGQGHLWSQTPSWITVFHDSDHPSCVLLPITRGNLIGTFISGGNIPVR